MSVPMGAIAKTVEALLRSGARKATKYVGTKATIKATRRFKPRARDRQTDILVTFGAPNYAERRVIKRGPPKGVVLTHYR